MGGVSGVGCVRKFLLEIIQLLLTLYAREVLTGERVLLDPRYGVHFDARPAHPPTHQATDPPTHPPTPPPPHPPVPFSSHIS